MSDLRDFPEVLFRLFSGGCRPADKRLQRSGFMIQPWGFNSRAILTGRKKLPSRKLRCNFH